MGSPSSPGKPAPDIKPVADSEKIEQTRRQNDKNTSADTPGRAPNSSQLRDRNVASDPPIDIAGPDD